MTYRVEYNGEGIEVTTLDAALDSAKNAIAADVGPISGWTVEHDDAINDWFVQGVLEGTPIGPTAVVSGPEPIGLPPSPVPRDLGVVVGTEADEAGIRATTTPRSRGRERGREGGREWDGEWVRVVGFGGSTPAEAFGKATAWLAGHPGVVAVTDVGWQSTANGPQLRIYYRA
jgi:hypothetical protein